jgi:hypothetical protein
MLRRIGTGWMDGSFSIRVGGLDPDERSALRPCAKSRRRPVFRSIRVIEVCSYVAQPDRGHDGVGHFFSARRWTGTPRICEP